MLYRISSIVAALIALPCASPSQQVLPPNPIQPGTTAISEDNSSTEPESKRIFGIIPNYRSSPTFADFEPLTRREKFKLATEDSFDRGTFVLAGMFAGEAQLTNANKSFGQGAAGYGRYYGTSFGDLVVGDYMTEAVYPTLLHKDPRYFRRGTGNGWSRLSYAMSQIIWTHGDSGATQFNYSELMGNATAVAISQAYYSDNRTASNAVSKLGMQLGVDAAANILKEFWPDFQRKFSRKHHQETAIR